MAQLAGVPRESSGDDLAQALSRWRSGSGDVDREQLTRVIGQEVERHLRELILLVSHRSQQMSDGSVRVVGIRQHLMYPQQFQWLEGGGRVGFLLKNVSLVRCFDFSYHRLRIIPYDACFWSDGQLLRELRESLWGKRIYRTHLFIGNDAISDREQAIRRSPQATILDMMKKVLFSPRQLC